MDRAYPKAAGSAGSKGVDFQVNLLCMFLLNALRNDLKNWKLSTENKLAAKFDDIVLEIADGSAIMVQAKHKEKRKVTPDQLLSINSKNDEFSLPKYFCSYLNIKTKFSVRSLIICTNTHFDLKVLTFAAKNSVDNQNMLHYQADQFYYSFTDSIVCDLIVNAKEYRKQHLENKDVDETDITEENALDFLKHLEFHVDYPSGNHLVKAAEKLLSSMKSSNSMFRDVSFRDLLQKVKDWFQCPKGEYLTERLAMAMFCEIKSDKYLDSLDNYKVSFKSTDPKVFNSKKRILHVVADGGYLLHMINIYHSLQHDKMKVLYAGYEYGKNMLQQTIETFELPKYTCLVIALTGSSEIEINEIFDILLNNLQSRDYKQVIFVTRGNDLLVRRMKSTKIDYDILEDSLALEDLSESTQEMLKKKNIIFQGKKVKLQQMLPENVTESNKKTMNSQLLEILVKGKNLTVGTKFAYQEEVCRYYIERKFERIVKKMWSKNERILEGKEIISEEDICTRHEKIILISDIPGMGKTTVLKNLAIRIKKSNPRLWVVRIELNRCTNVLRACMLKNRSIDAWELLNCEGSVHSANGLEKFVFELKGTVVLMLDGVDEISPDYTQLILNFLLQSQKADNLLKVFVTTRSHMVSELETELKTTSFNLVALTEDNQVDFFSRYWMYSLKLEDEKITKCKQYANALLSKISSWIREWDSEIKFVASPLHSRMLAEIFLENKESEEWQGIKEFLTTEKIKPELPENMNIPRLYEMFIQKKRSIFMGKGNPSGNTMANQALKGQFEECLAYHRSLALKVVFENRECTFFSCCKHGTGDDEEKNVLKMGIVHKSNNQLLFVHRTFAEYFVAESIFKELQLQNSDLGFQEFLIDTVFIGKKFAIIRKYIDNFLHDLTPPLSPYIFKRYMSRVNNTNNSNILHLMALESNNEIIRFVLELINFKVVKTKKQSLFNYLRLFKKNNTLTILKNLVNHHGIDVKHYGWTPLHYAVLGGHLDTVKLFLEMGADLNCGSENKGVVLTEKWVAYNKVFKYHEEYDIDLNSVMWDGHSPLHLAVGCCWFNIVQLLVERGADINVENDEGIRPLHYAAWCGCFDIVALLVQHGADVNAADSEGNTVVMFAAKAGNLRILEFLVERGADVHGGDRFGNTALHFSTEKRYFDIVEFLLEHDVDIHIADQGGHTALHFGIESDSLDMVILLIKHGANVNFPTNIEGYSVLELAVLKGNSEIVDFLGRKGVDVNIVNKNGDTPLHFAVRAGKLEIVELLVKYNANVNVANHKGRTPLDCAWKFKNVGIIKFLLKHNAHINTPQTESNNVRSSLPLGKTTWSSKWWE